MPAPRDAMASVRELAEIIRSWSTQKWNPARQVLADNIGIFLAALARSKRNDLAHPHRRLRGRRDAHLHRLEAPDAARHSGGGLTMTTPVKDQVWKDSAGWESQVLRVTDEAVLVIDEDGSKLELDRSEWPGWISERKLVEPQE